MSRKQIQLTVDAKKLEQWKKVNDLYYDVWTGVLTKCPECSRQLITCSCARRLANDVLYEAMKLIEEDDE